MEAGLRPDNSPPCYVRFSLEIAVFRRRSPRPDRLPDPYPIEYEIWMKF
jgi:hypothetical protein